MKVLLAIPSKARADTLAKFSLPWLRLLPTWIHWVVFVEPQDWDAYAAVLDFQQMLKLEKNDQGLGWAKEVIKEYAERHEYDIVFKLDDDIRGFTDYRMKLPPAQTANLLGNCLPQWLKCFEEQPALGAITFPYSFETWEQKQWEPTKRVQTAYLVRTKLLHADRRVSTFEDFSVGLNVLVRGSKIMRYGLAGIDMGVKVGGGTGGLQSFDRKELALKELDVLRGIYPPLTYRVVDKPWGIEPDLRSVKL